MPTNKYSCKGIVAGMFWLLCRVSSVFGGYCRNNTHFILTHTNFTRIDSKWYRDEINDCTGANHFNMSNNKFTIVENTSFHILWNVEILDLSYNEISVLESDALIGMRKLTHLYLSNNNIQNLPLGLFNNKHALTVVDLSFNQISRIPLPVFNYSMDKLREVLLHHNLLTAFEPWAYFRQAIQYFDLRWNNISKFTNDYNWTYEHRSVYDEASTDLRYNQITIWHDSYLWQYKTGKQVGIEAILAEVLTDVRDNPLVCDCNMHNLVISVRRSFYLWANVDYLNIRCYNPPELRSKRVLYEIQPTYFVCNISQNCPSGCLCQERPEERELNVDCRNKGLTRIPFMVPRSPYNITLQLDNNAIDWFDNVSYLHSISSVSLANNKLSSIPDFVIQAIASKGNARVDFSNNSLTSLPSQTEFIKYQDAKFYGNPLKCSCDALWMVNWINLAPSYADKTLSCEFEGTVYHIVDLTESLLKCHDTRSLILIVVLCVVLAIVIALLVTAKRCPYETKVFLFKVFRIHPSDKYHVDKSTDKTYDMYVSFDDNDPYVRQWVMKVLFKQLENKKPFYRMCVAARDAPAGPEAEGRLQLIEQSRRLLIILSEDYEQHVWCQYEMCHSETLEQNQGRILYLLYDKTAEENAKREPWLSKMKDRKVFYLQERMLWSKLRYEMPRKPLPKKQLPKRQEHCDTYSASKPHEFTDLTKG